MRVKCLAQEHNTMSLVRSRTRTTRSGDERTNHEATGDGKLWDVTSKTKHKPIRDINLCSATSHYEIFRVQSYASLQLGKDCTCVERRCFYLGHKVTKIFFICLVHYSFQKTSSFISVCFVCRRKDRIF